jgi:acetyl esterase/lipase
MTIRRLVRAYGEHPRQVGEWFLPAHSRDVPLVVLVHGGFWRPKWDRSLEVDVACDLAEHGLAVWNIEYRSYDDRWPATLEDVATAIDFGVADAREFGVDTSRSAIVGHSAGGMLALWSISRSDTSAGSAVSLRGVAHVFDLAVVTAPVACLGSAADDGIGEGAVEQFVGGSPSSVPERYAVSDPSRLTPHSHTRIVLIHGSADDEVALSQSQMYATTMAERGIDVTFTVISGGGHYEILDPTSEESAIRRELLLGL